VKLEADVLAAYPAEVPIPAELVASTLAASNAETPRVLVVLDDDPTGTQSVADLPVLTRWEVEDFIWAFGQSKPAVYVLTNTRSLDPAEAAARNEEVVRNALAAAGSPDTLRLGFVSRSDSTLRGHYPLEPDVIAATVADVSGEKTDGVVLVPAFPDAGRVTIGGVHYMRGTGEAAGTLTPVSDTEFAKDATFGFATSVMADYVEEKSQGRFAADSVIVLDLNTIRAGASAENPAEGAQISANAIADAIEAATDSTPIVADIVTENDSAPCPWAWKKPNAAARSSSTAWDRRSAAPGSARKSEPNSAALKPTPATPRPKPAASSSSVPMWASPPASSRP
jgi:hypothetical protein